MICDNCVHDLERSIVARTGVPVTCVAYCCSNYIHQLGPIISKCEPFKKRILDTIERTHTPIDNRRHRNPRTEEDGEV